MDSRTRQVAALKGFFRFLVENEYLEQDPALVLRSRLRGSNYDAYAGCRSGSSTFSSAAPAAPFSTSNVSCTSS